MTTQRNENARARGPRIAAGLLGIAVFALAAAGCSMGAAGYGATTPPAASAAAAPAAGQAIATQSTSLGVILVDGSGRTVYEFANDANGTSACTGACAANWPPVAAPSPLPTSMSGVTGQLGSITRDDGSSQLTIAGHPLYTFAGDTAAGQTNGQGKVLNGGLWTVATAAGAPVTSASPGGAATAAPVAPSY